MMGLDVNGNDNSPEWGYCTAEGCTEEAFPIWKSGAEPDDPDLLLCPKHIGETVGSLEKDRDQWKRGSVGMTRELRKLAESAGVKFEPSRDQDGFEHWGWRFGNEWHPAYVGEGGAAFGAIRWICEHMQEWQADAAALRQALWRPSVYSNGPVACVLCGEAAPLYFSHCAAVGHDAGAALLAELDTARQERHSALMDAGALRAALLKCYDAWTPPIPDWLIEAATGQIGQQAMQEIASALAERAELDAARAVAQALAAGIARDGYCPICHQTESVTLQTGYYTHHEDCALAAYDAAVKVSRP